MKKVKINTKGMHCTSCESLIEMALEDVEGVHSVSSSYKKGIVEVEFDPDRTDIEDLKQAIQNEGFKV